MQHAKKPIRTHLGIKVLHFLMHSFQNMFTYLGRLEVNVYHKGQNPLHQERPL